MRRVLLSLAAGAAAMTMGASDPVARVNIGDVQRFYEIYDTAQGHPTGAALQSGYIDAGSDGVRQFVPHRIVSGESLARRIGAKPELYEAARRCADSLPDVRTRVEAAAARFHTLYPVAQPPNVTILIGGANSGGTAGDAGVLIGLEVVCASSHLQPDISDRLTHLVAHEMVHVEQVLANPDGQSATVLSQSLTEGVAEFIGELISGQVSNVHLHEWNRGREREIADAFMADVDKTDLSAWLYNGVGTAEQPGDQGYWVGYQIARAYYERASDKPAALVELITQADPHRILEQSGWRG